VVGQYLADDVGCFDGYDLIFCLLAYFLDVHLDDCLAGFLVGLVDCLVVVEFVQLLLVYLCQLVEVHVYAVAAENQHGLGFDDCFDFVAVVQKIAADLQLVGRYLCFLLGS
jgi:hypothetical protein